MDGSKHNLEMGREPAPDTGRELSAEVQELIAMSAKATDEMRRLQGLDDEAIAKLNAIEDPEARARFERAYKHVADRKRGVTKAYEIAEAMVEKLGTGLGADDDATDADLPSERSN